MLAILFQASGMVLISLFTPGGDSERSQTREANAAAVKPAELQPPAKPAGLAPKNVPVPPQAAPLGPRAVHTRLQQSASVGFDQGTRLQDALELISDKYDLTIFIDEEAFKKEEATKLQAERKEVGVRPIVLPKANDVKLQFVLTTLLGQGDADFLIKDNMITVVPRDWVKGGMPIRQPVDVDVDNGTLQEVFEELSDHTGVSIVLDDRVGEPTKKNLTARFHRGPLVTAVSVLADMRSLRAVLLGNLLYVTTKENAALFDKQQAPALRAVDPTYRPDARPPLAASARPDAAVAKSKR